MTSAERWPKRFSDYWHRAVNDEIPLTQVMVGLSARETYATSLTSGTACTTDSARWANTHAIKVRHTFVYPK